MASGGGGGGGGGKTIELWSVEVGEEEEEGRQYKCGQW